MSLVTDKRVSTRQEILRAGLRCYYAEGGRSLERPHCQEVAVVAYGTIVLCAMCKAMKSAGREVPRTIPGSELKELLEGADELRRAEERVNKAVRCARAAGASWGQIGDAVGISRQAAQQRFGAERPPPG